MYETRGLKKSKARIFIFRYGHTDDRDHERLKCYKCTVKNDRKILIDLDDLKISLKGISLFLKAKSKISTKYKICIFSETFSKKKFSLPYLVLTRDIHLY